MKHTCKRRNQKHVKNNRVRTKLFTIHLPSVVGYQLPVRDSEIDMWTSTLKVESPHG